ncbi:MAG TPA: hypothetical protein VMU24_14035 [Candidatus Acidoferrales bacterium]|nr:hypothetical protein [Candidatus Acidoferrales bacterium]
MKKAILVFLLGGACVWTACGGGSSSSGKPKSGLQYRAFVTNYYAGSMVVLDAQNDKVSSSTEILGANPTTIVSSPDGKTSLIYNSASPSISAVDNATEAVNFTISLTKPSDSIVIAGDNKTGFAAERNASLSGYPLGAIQIFDYYDNSIATYVPVPDARFVAVDHSGKHLLVFSDLPTNVGSSPLTWNAYWVDLTNVDYTQSIQNLGTVLAMVDSSTQTPKYLNRPVAAFFSPDDTKAYILECGTECGGSLPASVTELTIATKTTRTVASPASGSAQWGARLGLVYNGSTLWATGSPQGVGGTAVSIDLNAMTAGTPHVYCGSGVSPCDSAMGDGTKVLMRQLNNKIFIGSKNCTTSSCLTVIDPASNSASLGKPAIAVNPNLGDVTGATYLSARNMYYLIEGGQVYLYDANYNQVLVNNFDVSGALYDVSYIPPQ